MSGNLKGLIIQGSRAVLEEIAPRYDLEKSEVDSIVNIIEERLLRGVERGEVESISAFKAIAKTAVADYCVDIVKKWRETVDDFDHKMNAKFKTAQN